MPKPRGLIMYEGPSVLDGEPIVVIATLHSNNEGTGDLIQTWILRSDVNPVDATKTGQDESVCGNCPHRWFHNGACYVNVGQAPNAVWKAYKRGSYPEYDNESSSYFENRIVRLGSYGDPAAAPYETWREILWHAAGHTGYTHQVRHRNFDPRVGNICMVSADSPRQAARYQREGYNTFRAKRATDSIIAREIPCPKQTGTQCINCRLCTGSSGANIVIDVHGSRKGKFLNAA